MRGLAAPAPTALPGWRAVRVREVSAPGAAELAEAERTLVLRHGRPVDGPQPPRRSS